MWQIVIPKDSKSTKRMSRTISLASAVLGAIWATVAAGLFLIQETEGPGSTAFPMPFLVLLDWAALGIAGAIYVSFVTLRSDARKLQGAWIVLGAYIPLIIIGGFSIGPFALVGALLLLAPAVFLTIRHGGSSVRLLGSLVIGLLANLTIILAFVLIGRLALAR